MKKIFTLIAASVLALGVQAQTLVEFKGGSKNVGTFQYVGDPDVAESTVKIHTNTDAVACIKFGKSAFADNAPAGYHAIVSAEGGFKAGDKIEIAGYYNNADEKNAAVVVFLEDGTKLFTTENFINGRLVADDATPQTFTLEEDADKLYLGRAGNTGTNVTTLIIYRGSKSEGGSEPGGETPSGNALIDYPTAKTGITISGTVAYDNTQKYHANADTPSNISFANGYTTDGVINGNYAALTVDGGFLAGDVVKVAGYFNNSDESKQAAVTIFVGNDGEAATDLWTSGLFINGRTNADDPTVESYTLDAAYETLKIGRANGLTGATRTNVTLLKVERGTSGISEVLNVNVSKGAIYNLAGQKVANSYKGVAIMNGKKVVMK